MNPIRLALFQPDIPQNTAAMLRLAACLDIGVDVIEPCGFVFDEKRMKRVGMDYLDHVELTRHASWEKFSENKPGRLILLSTKAATCYTDFDFESGDTLMVGQESSGVPEEVFAQCDHQVLIPMSKAVRSLNVAQSAAMVVGEALRQIGCFQTR